MSGIRARVASRLRSSSQSTKLATNPPLPNDTAFNPDLAKCASSVLFRSPILSAENRPIYILNAAALPDSRENDFDALLPYVLARLPEEDDLVKGYEYEVVLFAGDSDGSATNKKHRPGWGWFLQAYHVLSRAMRKRLQKLYIVHEKAWVRILAEIFSTIVSPKFRRKIVHASTMSNLALHLPIEDLLIPPSTYLYDRRVSDDIYAPYASGRRAFGARQPFPAGKTGSTRLPRVLRETTNFLLLEQNIVAEGLFRVPPHAKLKECLKEAYDRGQKYIVWKDNGVALELPEYPRAEHQDEIIAELDPRDAYSVYMAAGLIKSWYADLRQPIFPQGCYHDLKRLYGDPQDPPDLERLTDLLSPSSEWSFLSGTSRIILTRHLLPLLSAVTARQEQNKMTSENVAVCFAPTLLCGPDQLEDAKMSSIIRRILKEATDLWTEGLRTACKVEEHAFEDELRLPTDAAEWDDPIEGNRARAGTHTEDENQITGIILQDNEKPLEQPPPLPPRSSKPQPRSASGQSPSDTLTKRKPAPPLQVPPRYSTVMSDGHDDVSESPSSYAAVADGFAPPRQTQWDLPEEKTTGTNRSGDSHHSPPQIALPKRKALTAEQIDNAETAVAQVRARGLSGHGQALLGLAKLPTSDFPKPKTIPSSRESSETSLPVAPVAPVIPPPALSSILTFPESSERQTEGGFRRPSWAASANRAPQIASLARPVFPTNTPTNRPASKSTSLPVPGPKPRTPSPSLLERMPSFETSKASPSLAPPANPRRLNMKKASVDDLRRLYEERTSTAKALVEATKW